jgi:hypothetical protein
MFRTTHDVQKHAQNHLFKWLCKVPMCYRAVSGRLLPKRGILHHMKGYKDKGHLDNCDVDPVPEMVAIAAFEMTNSKMEAL